MARRSTEVIDVGVEHRRQRPDPGRGEAAGARSGGHAARPRRCGGAAARSRGRTGGRGGPRAAVPGGPRPALRGGAGCWAWKQQRRRGFRLGAQEGPLDLHLLVRDLMPRHRRTWQSLARRTRERAQGGRGCGGSRRPWAVSQRSTAGSAQRRVPRAAPGAGPSVTTVTRSPARASNSPSRPARASSGRPRAPAARRGAAEDHVQAGAGRQDLQGGEDPELMVSLLTACSGKVRLASSGDQCSA